MRHRRGTPGLTPYRLRTIEAGHPRRRPARHLRDGKAPTAKPSLTSSWPSAVPSTLPHGDHHSWPSAAPSPTSGTMAPNRGRPARRSTAARRRIAGSQVAMGFAGLIAFALLVVGGYQAAAGAAVVLGMF